jgi:hypothetical protein
VICGLGTSLLAWAILHYLDKDAFSVITSVVMISLAVDNYRLRRTPAKTRSPVAK